MPNLERPLTSKQLKFAEVYDGNGTQAARLAGYKGSDNVLAQVAVENLRNPKILEAIKAREKREIRGAIKTRLERQKFWSDLMDNEDPQVALRASELLGKSEADFTDRLETDTVSDVARVVREARERARQARNGGAA